MHIKTVLKIQGAMLIVLGLAATLWGVAFFIAWNNLPVMSLVVFLAKASIVLTLVALLGNSMVVSVGAKVVHGILLTVVGMWLHNSTRGFDAFEPIMWIIAAAVLFMFTFKRSEPSDIAQIRAQG